MNRELCSSNDGMAKADLPLDNKICIANADLHSLHPIVPASLLCLEGLAAFEELSAAAVQHWTLQKTEENCLTL